MVDKLNKEAKKVYLAYILMACTSVFTVCGFLLCLVNINKSKGTIFYSHYKWLINTFIMSVPFFITLLAFTVLSIVQSDYFGGIFSYLFITLGWLLIIGWWTMRLMIGVLELRDNKEIKISDFK